MELLIIKVLAAVAILVEISPHMVGDHDEVTRQPECLGVKRLRYPSLFRRPPVRPPAP